MPTVIEERLRVRYADTDQMGHAYYANYLVWFEQARGAYFRERGLPYKQIEAMGYKFPVVEAHAKYHGEAKYDDEICIRVWVEEVRRASVKVAYEVWNETTNKSITHGYTVHVMVGSEFKAISIPAAIRAVLEG